MADLPPPERLLMKPVELGYAVVPATDIAAWTDFAGEVLGAMPVPGPCGTLSIRTDERSARLVVVPAETDAFRAAGWLMASKAAFDGLRDRLVKADVGLRPGTDAEREIRHVTDFFSFTDPAGNVHEIALGPVAGPDQFVSPHGVRFITGAGGMGHVVLPSGPHLTEATEFWTATMGLTIANFRTFPGGANGNFFTCNDRQHSMLIVEWPMRNGVQHINLEVATLDDVGRALDRASTRNLVRRTLGKHVNDNMVSFYMQTPGGFQIEYGFSDGDPLWRPGVYFADSAGSYWGHEHLA
jgi:3,4-dihydroxy-9,10-secoandrosta-1,3,5(10)-triene-9,17-dione 4,5-dioxygenase